MTKYIKSGFLLSLPIFIILFILYNVGSVLAVIGKSITGNVWSGLGLVILALMAIFFALGLMAHHLSIDKPFVGMLFKVMPSLRIVSRIKKGNGAFPEVVFRSYDRGVYKRGILMAENKAINGKNLCAVFEPRPFALSGPVHLLEPHRIKKTGRLGWELIKELMTYGIE